MGHLYDESALDGLPDELARRAPRAEERDISSSMGQSFRRSKRYYDVENRRLIQEFESQGDDGEIVMVDDMSGAIVGSYTMRDHGRSTKQTDVGRYSATSRWKAPGTQRVSIEVEQTNGPFYTCTMCLDWNSTTMPGLPRVVEETTESTVCHAAIAYWECSNNGVALLGFPSTERGRQLQAYFWTYDLGLFARSVLGYNSTYPWTNVKPVAVRIVPIGGAVQCGTGMCATSTASQHRITFENWYEMDLEQLAHEYGHVMHYMYGYFGDGASNRGRAIKEGFADHNILRYAMYRGTGNRASYDDQFTHTYDTMHDLEHRIRHRFFRGESYPETPAESNYYLMQRNLVYNPANSESPCYTSLVEGGPYSDAYACGRLLSIIYWQLAWNTMRVGTSGWPAGTTIIQAPQLWTTPLQLVNAAYSYAIQGLPSNATIDDFFRRVSEHYWAERYYYFSQEDYDRVAHVLTHHCVGWSRGQCTSWHHTPGGNPLPQSITQKENLNNGNGLFILASSMMPLGGATTYSWNRGDGSSYQYVGGPGQYIETSIVIPSGKQGYYEVEVAARRPYSSDTGLLVQFDTGSDVTLTLNESVGLWRWENNSGTTPPVTYLTAGTHTLRIKYLGRAGIDVVYVRRCANYTCNEAEQVPPGMRMNQDFP